MVGLFVRIKALFSLIFGFLGRVLRGSTGVILFSVIEIAQEVVTELQEEAYSGLNNAELRDLAYKMIEDRAISKGKNVATHVINLAIELAVAEIKQ